jgi:hypothetical protein
MCTFWVCAVAPLAPDPDILILAEISSCFYNLVMHQSYDDVAPFVSVSCACSCACVMCAATAAAL